MTPSREYKTSCHVQGKLQRAQRALQNHRQYIIAIVKSTDDSRSAKTIGEFPRKVIRDGSRGSNVVHRTGSSLFVYECFETQCAIKEYLKISSTG